MAKSDPEPTQHKRKLLVIFGAGASFDSIDPAGRQIQDTSARPPLAADLFHVSYDGLFQRHRAAGPLVAQVRRLNATVSLEDELDRIQRDEVPKSPVRRREFLALRFYLRDLLWRAAAWSESAPGQTNYHLLLQQLARWREETASPIGLVTFNYDTMLERAVEDVFGLRFSSVDDLIADENVKVFRPHGSCGWVRVVQNATGVDTGGSAEDIEFQLLQLAATQGVELASTYHLITERDTLVGPGRRPVVPALTVPARDKGVFEFPGDHESALRDFMKDLIYVLVVGWRASELNFLRMWSAADKYTQPRLLVVNGSARGGEGTLRALVEAGIRFSQSEVSEGGFSRLTGQSDALTRFLRSRLPGIEALSGGAKSSWTLG